MLRKFLAETVTNGSIGLNRPKGYIPLGQRQKKAGAGCDNTGRLYGVVCLLCPTFRAESLVDYIPAYMLQTWLECISGFMSIPCSVFLHPAE